MGGRGAPHQVTRRLGGGGGRHGKRGPARKSQHGKVLDGPSPDLKPGPQKSEDGGQGSGGGVDRGMPLPEEGDQRRGGEPVAGAHEVVVAARQQHPRRDPLRVSAGPQADLAHLDQVREGALLPGRRKRQGGVFARKTRGPRRDGDGERGGGRALGAVANGGQARPRQPRAGVLGDARGQGQRVDVDLGLHVQEGGARSGRRAPRRPFDPHDQTRLRVPAQAQRDEEGHRPRLALQGRQNARIQRPPQGRVPQGLQRGGGRGRRGAGGRDGPGGRDVGGAVEVLQVGRTNGHLREARARLPRGVATDQIQQGVEAVARARGQPYRV